MQVRNMRRITELIISLIMSIYFACSGGFSVSKRTGFISLSMSDKVVNVPVFTPNNLRLHDNPILSFPGEYHPVYVNDRSMLLDFASSFSNIGTSQFESVVESCVQDIEESLAAQGIALTRLDGSMNKSIIDFIQSKRYSKGTMSTSLELSLQCLTVSNPPYSQCPYCALIDRADEVLCFSIRKISNS